MAEYFVQRDTLISIADAVRRKTQTTGTIKVSSLADKIKEIKITNEVLNENNEFRGFIDGTITEVDHSTAESLCMYAFSNCSLLTRVNLPELKDIPSYAFYRCSNLTHITLPLVTKINENAFAYCTSLNKIDLPSVTSILTYVFNNCTALNALILRSSTMCTLSSTNSLSNTPIASGTGYIYVPSALVNSYKTATNWSTYASKFRAIEDYPDICNATGEVSE